MKVSVDFPAKNDWFRGTIIIISDAVWSHQCVLTQIVWLLWVCLYIFIQFTFKTVFVYHICSDEDWRERSDSVQAPDEGESLEMGPGQCQAGVQERQTRLHHRHPEASFVCFYLFLLCLNQQNVTVGQNAKLYGELWSFPVCFRPNSKTLNTLHDQY